MRPARFRSRASRNCRAQARASLPRRSTHHPASRRNSLCDTCPANRWAPMPLERRPLHTHHGSSHFRNAHFRNAHCRNAHCREARSPAHCRGDPHVDGSSTSLWRSVRLHAHDANNTRRASAPARQLPAICWLRNASLPSE
jgi:hypothetical protein